MAKQHLKSCPFCGAAPVCDRIEPHKHHIARLPDYPGSWTVECVECEFQLFSHESADDVATRWNKRAADEPRAVDPDEITAIGLLGGVVSAYAAYRGPIERAAAFLQRLTEETSDG